MQKPNWIIGIDSGTKTGLAVWWAQEKKFTSIDTLPIHKAMEAVKELLHVSNHILVRVEDARKRKWFGNSGREQLQGAGSIKRDAKIWEDYLTDLGVKFEMVAPKNNKTKVDAEVFKKLTKWEGRTSEHSRDAAMLCFGM
jgi:hypothetical protein